MARYEGEFREFGKTIARARGGRPEVVQEQLNEQIDKKYTGGAKNVRKTKTSR